MYLSVFIVKNEHIYFTSIDDNYLLLLCKYILLLYNYNK